MLIKTTRQTSALIGTTRQLPTLLTISDAADELSTSVSESTNSYASACSIWSSWGRRGRGSRESRSQGWRRDATNRATTSVT